MTTPDSYTGKIRIADGYIEVVDGRIESHTEEPQSGSWYDYTGELFDALGLDAADYEDTLPSWADLLDIARKHAARPVAPDPRTVAVVNEGSVIMMVDGEPKPVEVEDGKVRVSSDAPWLVADDAIRINTAARRPTDPDVDVVGQVKAEVDVVASPAPRLALVNVDGGHLTIRASDDWRVEVDESGDAEKVTITRDAPRNASGDILTENDPGFPVSPLLSAVDHAMGGNTYRLLDGQGSADAVAGLAATLAAAQPIVDTILGKGLVLTAETMREAAAELTRANVAFANLVADERKRAEASAVGGLGECSQCERYRVLLSAERNRCDALEANAVYSPKAQTSLTRQHLGAIAAALAPGEALDLPGIIARAAAYRRHSIELAAIRAVVDPVVRGVAVGIDPFPWDAAEVGDTHDRVCVLVDAMNKAADALAKVRGQR